MSLFIKYWGVRGSLPSCQPPEQWFKDFEHLMHGFFQAGYSQPSHVRDYMKTLTIPQVGGYGTATTCVEVQSANSRIIIDGGSGLRMLGEKMVKSGSGRKVNIFLTHFHWDHLIGLPFFIPHFIPGNEINYYAVQPELEQMVRGQFKRPNFPVAFESLPSKINFHSLEPRKPIKIDDMTITPYQLDHPDPCWGYKIQSGGKTYAHCVDTEGTRSSRESLGPDLPLYQGADLMYFDAQYTLPELAEKANWGHSAAQIGLDIAFREAIKYVIFAHHDPGASTDQIYELKKQTREYYEWKVKSAETSKLTLPTVKWRYAYEGLEVDLGEM